MKLFSFFPDSCPFSSLLLHSFSRNLVMSFGKQTIELAFVLFFLVLTLGKLLESFFASIFSFTSGGVAVFDSESYFYCLCLFPILLLFLILLLFCSFLKPPPFLFYGHHVLLLFSSLSFLCFAFFFLFPSFLRPQLLLSPFVEVFSSLVTACQCAFCSATIASISLTL